ncbi:MAG: glycosyltransferase [Paludibacteraceae bacterium]
MKPRLLILTDPYGKPSYAPRLRYLCDYLVRNGYCIDVYTEQFQPHDFPHDYPIHERPVHQTMWQWAIQSFWSLLTDYRNRKFSKWVQRATADTRYDVVFCTTFSTFPLRAAYEVATKRHIPFIADIRDLDEQVPGAQYQSHRQWWTRPFRQWYRNVNIRRRNKVLRHATLVSTVSPWHVDFIKRTINPNVHLIYNGYDPQQFYFAPVKSHQFLISYIGKIYDFQDPTPIERAIRELNISDIVLNYHTPTYNPIPITAVGDEIRRSSICIVLTNKSAKGMMTTKFYESLGCEKPILCVPSDESVLAITIQNTNAGIATENVEEIKQFILEKYHEWQVNGYTHQEVRNKEQFSREYQARQFEELFLQCLQ